MALIWELEFISSGVTAAVCDRFRMISVVLQFLYHIEVESGIALVWLL